ncbi:MAG TPA: XylR family transcriptional regulator [Spirochaetia bacterium]|nr:XylR family transcriptional regulator [Spirochaetia bacterium]
MRAHRRRRVGLFMGLIDHYEHGIARGVVRLARERSDWDLYGYGWMFQAMGFLERWDGDGIVARIESSRDADVLAARGIPVVDVAGAWMRPGFRQVSNDDVLTGRLAARHLLGLGRRHVAFCGVSRVGWSRARRDAFRGTMGIDRMSVFEQSLVWWERLHSSDRLDRWLAGLERPVALFACNDTVGLKTAAACRRLGLAVPADVAILGVDNEDILCELSVPPLSSIALDLERIGWEAARALADVLDGKAGRAAPLVVPPREVVERDSTWAITTGDELVDRALEVIHGASGPWPTVGQILLTVHCSRRALEKRFRGARGRGIHEEIIRRRVEAARRLLRDTNLTVDAIADETGFASAQRFYASFRKIQGTTPGRYRRSYRR